MLSLMEENSKTLTRFKVGNRVARIRYLHGLKCEKGSESREQGGGSWSVGGILPTLFSEESST